MTPENSPGTPKAVRVFELTPLGEKAAKALEEAKAILKETAPNEGESGQEPSIQQAQVDNNP